MAPRRASSVLPVGIVAAGGDGYDCSHSAAIRSGTTARPGRAGGPFLLHPSTNPDTGYPQPSRHYAMMMSEDVKFALGF